MKTLKNKWFQLGLMAVMAFGMSACSDDDEIAPLFPEDKEALICVANGTTTYELEANMDWKLSSDASWCTLVVNGKEEGTDISGTAGDYTVTFKASDENWKFEDATANITLTMGGKSEVVAVVTRPAKTPELTIVELEGTTIAMESDQAIYEASANFEVAVLSAPEWLEVTVTPYEEDASMNTIILNVAEDKIQNPLTGEVVLGNSDINASFTYSVKYAGMDENSIIISGNTPWNWEVSLDGKTFKQGNDNGEPKNLTDNIPFTIMARNSEFVLVPLEVSSWGGDNLFPFDEAAGIPSWIKTAVDGNNVTVTIDEFPTWGGPASRTGYLFAFPAKKYEEIKEEILMDGMESTFIDKYINYVVLNIVQKAPSVPVAVTLDGAEVATSEGYDESAEWAYVISSELSISDKSIVYTMSAKAGKTYKANPKLAASDFGYYSEWSDWVGACIAFDLSSNSKTSDLGADFNANSWQTNLNETNCKTDDEGASYYVTFTTPESFTKPYLLVFYNPQGMPKKALVVKPE
ncbi:MAG: DUF5003 domain-containing protein [Bacteroides sp.]|nr:DUF5003 domain-containing protein [Bacteroides sp.]